MIYLIFCTWYLKLWTSVSKLTFEFDDYFLYHNFSFLRLNFDLVTHYYDFIP